LGISYVILCKLAHVVEHFRKPNGKVYSHTKPKIKETITGVRNGTLRAGGSNWGIERSRAQWRSQKFVMEGFKISLVWDQWGRVPPRKFSTEFCVAEFDIYCTSKQ